MSNSHCFYSGIALVVGLGAGSGHLQGATPKSGEVGISWMSYQMQSLTSSPSGKKDTLGTSFYHLSVQYHQPIAKVLWSPWLKYMPENVHAVRSPNKSSKTSILALGTPITWNYSGHIDFGTGPVLMYYTVHGVGSGTEVTNNGESTATFFQPTESKSAVTMAWQFGSAWNAGAYRIGADVLVHGLTSTTKRSFSVMTTGTWVISKRG